MAQGSCVTVWISRIFAVVVCLAVACPGSDAPAPPASHEPTAIAPPIGLVGELTIPDPKRLWASLRKLGGSRAEEQPSSYELALFLAFDVPARAAGYVRPDSPVVGVVLAPP